MQPKEPVISLWSLWRPKQKLTEQKSEYWIIFAQQGTTYRSLEICLIGSFFVQDYNHRAEMLDFE